MTTFDAATASPESVQLELSLAPFVVPAYEPEMSIQQRYELWRDANAWVIPALGALLDDWSRHGKRRVGVKAAAEWLRMEYAHRLRSQDFAVNNSYTSRIARDLIERFPQLADVIETRELKAA